MPDPIVATQEPVTTSQPVVKEPDLITKVAQFKKETSSVSTDTAHKEFDDIKDPVAKEIAIKRDKERQADYVRKTQDLAQQRKDLEAKVTEINTWSPERIQKELLTNPTFLSSAQMVSSTSVKDDTFLTDEEKENRSKIANMEGELQRLKANNYQALIIQQDATLQSRYGEDYKPSDIDSTIEKMSKMQPHLLREYVYKAINYEEGLKKAYELGKNESKQINNDKINAFSVSGNQVRSGENTPVREKGESDQSFLTRIMQNRLAQFKK